MPVRKMTYHGEQADPARDEVLATFNAAAQEAIETAPQDEEWAESIPATTGLGAMIAAIPVAPGLTAEQSDIVRTAKAIEAARNNGQRVMVIGAGAGTGKTFTLKQLEQVLTGEGQYTAFNSSLVAESKAKFRRASCNTTHSLAFRAVGKRFAHRLGGARVKSHAIASMLGIEDYYVELPDSIQPPDAEGRPATRRLKAAYLAGQVTGAIRKFCQSADPKITVRHFGHIDGIDDPRSYDNSNKVKAYLLPFAEKAWADLSSETGRLPFSHDVYVKVWQLGTGPDRPVIAADYILLDEAQDTAPVFLDILKQQTHSLLVFVGDSNQAIYEWRGAVDAMKAYPKAERRLLSQSFRFGQAVADVANSILATLDEPTDLIMKGTPTIPSRVCPVANPRCYLYRTNAGAVGRLMSAMEEGKRGHLIGGSKEVISFCEAATDLQAGRGTSHPELGCFTTWQEVEDYSKEDEGADLRLMVKLINDFGSEEIAKALRGMPKEEDADLILSTAHKSKGREWTSVKLGADFPTANKMTDADRRLLYVACTRAQEELDVTSCPTFIGGIDKSSGDDEFIAGLPITYTAPMPKADALDAYRRAKSAPKTAPDASARDNAASAPIAPSAPAAASANGPEFTWANMDGTWCIRGPKEQTLNQPVTVTRKNGTTSRECLRSVVRKLGEVWFYGVK